MFRNARIGTAFGLALVLAACGEVTTAPQADVSRIDVSASVVPGTCTNLTQLNSLSAVLFTPSSSPNINSVKGKLKNLDGLVRKGKIADAKAQAGEIVAFALKKYNQGGLAGTSADVKAFTNAVLCFAGIDIVVPLPENNFFILPSDQPQVITNTAGNAGISFDANPVSEPTLVAITVLGGSFPPGGGPLSTRLDQYPGYIQITKTSEGNAPLAKPAVVGVCASGSIPTDVRARLRLGHQASYGFEVTPSATADFINCPNLTAEAPLKSNWDRLADLVLPQRAHAFQSADFGGGVGGTVTEFSPFAPVDPQLEFGGGVGGTVTEFTRSGFNLKSALVSQAFALAGACPTPIEGAMGSPVREECRPHVTITTHLGTPFSGVPVTWDITQGGGSAAANDGTCGVFGASAATTTGPNGGAGICWTLGTVGANQVRATPALGGDAVAGVTFSQASILFDAVANPPAGVVFTQQPPSVVQAWPRWPIGVTVVDKNGERVWASADRIFLGINHDTFTDGETELNIKAVNGVASYDISVPVVGSDYQITASTPLSSWTIANGVSNTFSVIPGAPYLIQVVSGSGVSATTGSVLTPRVRVTDRAGNVVPGTTVAWAVVPDSPGAASPATSVTDASGEATTNWTIGAGLNFMRAMLTTGSLLYITLSATGTSP